MTDLSTFSAARAQLGLNARLVKKTGTCLGHRPISHVHHTSYRMVSMYCDRSEVSIIRSSSHHYVAMSVVNYSVEGDCQRRSQLFNIKAGRKHGCRVPASITWHRLHQLLTAARIKTVIILVPCADMICYRVSNTCWFNLKTA